jgi:hypothetical protein
MPGIKSAFEDMVTTHKGAGWKAFDHWKHYFRLGMTLTAMSASSKIQTLTFNARGST